MTTPLLIVLATLLATASPGPVAAQGGPDDLRQVWLAALGEARGARLEACAAVGAHVLVVDELGGVTAVDPATGALRWFVQAPGPLDFMPSDGGAVALASDGHVIVVDGATGRRRLETSGAHVPAVSPCSDGQRLYVPSLLGPTLVATDLGSGLKAWEFRFSSPFAGSSLVCGREGSRSVLVGFEDGTLRAIPAQADVPRAERWVARTGMPVGPPLVDAERVIVASRDHVVVALDAASGLVLWRHFPGEVPRTPPVRAGDVLVFGTATRLVALDPDTGAERWVQQETGRPLGEVDGGVLVRTRGGSQWRAARDGRVLQAHLPATTVAVAGRMVELREGRDLAGWVAPRR